VGGVLEPQAVAAWALPHLLAKFAENAGESFQPVPDNDEHAGEGSRAVPRAACGCAAV
jgi:hypothetical protein